MVRPKKVARDAMVYPVKTIEPERTLEEAGEILARYNLSVLPVLHDEPRSAGRRPRGAGRRTR